MLGSARVKQWPIFLEMTSGYQIWQEEPLTKVYCIAGVKGHVGVSRSQPNVKLLRNASGYQI